jgi:hypothetical protein
MTEQMQEPDAPETDLEVAGDIAPPEQEAAQEPQVDPEIEAQARKYGWRPLTEYTLDPKGWVDARKFMDLPQTQVKALRDEIRDRDKRLERVERTTQRAVELAREQERAAYEARLQEIEAAKRKAAEDADIARYDQLANMQRTLRPPQHDEPPQEVAQYLETTKWGKDPAAIAFGAQLIEANPAIKTLPAMDQVRWAEAQMRMIRPEWFDAPTQAAPARPAVSKVDGGSTVAPIRAPTRGADSLPPEARRAGEGFVRMGIYKSVDDYAKDYWQENNR